MLLFFIILATAVLAGIGFWFYNKKQINSLSEQIDDKNVVINALKNHVEETKPTVDLNTEWRGTANQPVNLTPTVDEAISSNKQKNRKYKNSQKSGSKQHSSNKDGSKKQKQGQDQNPRPRKNKPSKNS
jgi:outer membrane murein-binding lipoprotein Lpp